jgi:hypothetical protein
LIELPPDHELAEKVTHHSNNQNPINARDLQSNSTFQRRLQNEFATKYKGKVFYRIKRGEPDQEPQVIDNDEAGRVLLAFDLKRRAVRILVYVGSDINQNPYRPPSRSPEADLALKSYSQIALLHSHLFLHDQLTFADISGTDRKKLP